MSFPYSTRVETLASGTICIFNILTLSCLNTDECFVVNSHAVALANVNILLGDVRQTAGRLMTSYIHDEYYYCYHHDRYSSTSQNLSGLWKLCVSYRMSSKSFMISLVMRDNRTHLIKMVSLRRREIGASRWIRDAVLPFRSDWKRTTRLFSRVASVSNSGRTSQFAVVVNNRFQYPRISGWPFHVDCVERLWENVEK